MLDSERSAWRTVWIGILFAFVLLVALEVGARQVAWGPLGRQLPFAATLGVGNPQLDVKWMRLQAMQQQTGVNCVVVGSSMVNVGVDAQQLSQQLGQQSNGKWHCFNLGLSTLTGEPAGVIGRLVVRQTQPRLLIYGISARDFSAQFGALSRPLDDAPWVRYRLGEEVFAGWLFEHSFLHRYNVAFKSWLLPANRQTMEQYQHWTAEDGFSASNENNPEPLPERPLMENFYINSADWEGLQALVALNGPQTRVVVVEMPVQEGYLPFYLAGGRDAYETLFINPLDEYLTAHGIVLLRGQAIASSIPAEGWYDQRHFNAKGAQLFTSWLAKELIRLGVD
jgi:hypothetical protein